MPNGLKMRSCTPLSEFPHAVANSAHRAVQKTGDVLWNWERQKSEEGVC